MTVLLTLQMMEQHRSLIRHCYSMWKPTHGKNHLCQTMNTATFSPTYQQHLRITCRWGRTNGAHSLTVALFPFGFPVQIFGIVYKRMAKAITSLICLTPITTWREQCRLGNMDSYSVHKHSQRFLLIRTAQRLEQEARTQFSRGRDVKDFQLVGTKIVTLQLRELSSKILLLWSSQCYKEQNANCDGRH